jgi:hypothetical protein
MPAIRPAIAVRARTLETRIIFRIGSSAVDEMPWNGAIVTVEGPARKPSLLILRRVAYPDRGRPGAIIIDDEFSAR